MDIFNWVISIPDGALNESSKTPTTSTPEAAKDQKPTAQGTPEAKAQATNQTPPAAVTAAQAQANKFKESAQKIRSLEQQNISNFTDLKLPDEYGDSVFYRIIYEATQGKFKTYNFVLLPARETKIGNWNVPDVKPGVPLMASMRHKITTVPGSGPLVQTVGIAGTTFNLVGALIGTEEINDYAGSISSAILKDWGLVKDPRDSLKPNSSDPIKAQGLNTLPSPSSILGPSYSTLAYNKANKLLEEVFYPGRAIVVEVKGAGNQSTLEGVASSKDFIRYTAVIKTAKIQFVHADRVYYNLELFITSYPKTVTEPVSYYDLTTGKAVGDTAAAPAPGDTTGPNSATAPPTETTTPSKRPDGGSPAVTKETDQVALYEKYLNLINTQNRQTNFELIKRVYKEDYQTGRLKVSQMYELISLAISVFTPADSNSQQAINDLKALKASNPRDWSILTTYANQLIGFNTTKRKGVYGVYALLVAVIDSNNTAVQSFKVFRTPEVNEDALKLYVDALKLLNKQITVVDDPGLEE